MLTPARACCSRHALLSTTALGTGALVALAAAVVLAPPAAANPRGGNVVRGDAVITSPGAREVQIRQSSERAVIEWDSFSIGRDETTRFRQPSRGSVTLNRVTGSGDRPPLSEIAGRLEANGNVMLINPSGVVFTRTARIDVGGLIASTSDLDDEHFMTTTGPFRFVPGGDPDAVVRNDGAITVAEGGMAALVAPYVVNNGTITARLGRVALASGEAYTVDLYGDGLIHFEAGRSEPDAATPAEAGAQVSQDGAIFADGGLVELSVAEASGIVDNAISMNGVIEARSISAEADGRIVLHGGDQGAVQVAGRLDASASAEEARGGEVVVAGERIDLAAGATLDVSGPAGGGRALIGADVRGAPIPHPRPESLVAEAEPGEAPVPAFKPPQTVTVAAGASIAADATAEGDGGTVVAWADGATVFNGRATARGGPQGGDGGFIETSGGRLLVADATVDTGAPQGRPGRWLLDPTNITVIDDDVGTSDLSTVDDFLDPDFGGDLSLVFAPAIEGADADVVLQATDTVRIQTRLMMDNAGVGLVVQAGEDVLVTAPITTSGGIVHLEADSPHAPGGAAPGSGEVIIRESPDRAPPLVSSGGGDITIIGSNLRIQSPTDFASGAPFIDAGSGTASIAFTTGTISLGGDLSNFFAADTLINGAATTAGEDGRGDGTIDLSNDLLIVDPIVFPPAIDTVVLAHDTITVDAGVRGSIEAGDRLVIEGDVVSPGGFTATAGTIELQDVTTAGDQTYVGDVVLNGTYLTNGGDFEVAGATTLGAGLSTVDVTDPAAGGTSGGDIGFDGPVDSAGGATNDLTLIVGALGEISFEAPVGGAVPLGTLIRRRILDGADIDLTIADAEGVEDAGRDPGTVPIDLSIAVDADPDAEAPIITIGGIPAGADILVDGAVVSAGGTATVTADDLDTLAFRPTPDSDVTVELAVTAATGAGDGDFGPLPAGSVVGTLIDEGVGAASGAGTLTVELEAVADPPLLTVPGEPVDAVPGIETPVAITATATDEDGSESVEVTISDLPAGTIVRVDGAPVAADGAGGFTIDAEDLPGLTVEVADGPMASFDIDVVAAAIEAANAAREEVADSFVLRRITEGLVEVTASSPGGPEDTPIVLLIEVETVLDGEQVITVSNVPADATLSAGTDLGGGVWELSAEDLAALSVTPAPDDSTDLSLLVEAAVLVGEATLTTDAPTPLPVEVTAVADVATIDAPDEVTVPPGIPGEVGIEVASTDTDGSEMVEVVIEGLPRRATLSAGSRNADGSFTVPEDELDGLTVTVPAADDARITFPLTLEATPVDVDPDTGIEDRGDPVTDGLTLNVVGIRLSGAGASGLEDELIELTLALNADAPAGGRVVTVSGVPDGAELSVGTRVGDGVWRLRPGQLDGLALRPRDHDSRDLELSVVARVSADGTTLRDRTRVPVEVMAVTDPIRLTTPVGTTVRPGVPGRLEVSATTRDTDGSERVRVELTGLPEGARLSAGRRNPDGSFTVRADALDGLTVLVPVRTPESFTVDVTAEARDDDPETGLVPPDGIVRESGSFDVTVEPGPASNADEVRHVQDYLGSSQDPSQFIGRGRPARPADTTPATPIRLVPVEEVVDVADIAPGAGPEGEPGTTRPDEVPIEDLEPGDQVDLSQLEGAAGGLLAVDVGSGQTAGEAPADDEEAALLELEQIEACPDVTLPTVAWQNTATESAFNIDPQLVPYSVDVFCAGYKLARPGRGALAEYEGMTFVLEDFWTDLDQSRTSEPLAPLKETFELGPSR